MFSLVFSIQLPWSCRNQTCQQRNPLSSKSQRPRKARADQIPACPTSACPPVLFQAHFVIRGERQIPPEGRLSTSSMNPYVRALLWLQTPQRTEDTYKLPASVEACQGIWWERLQECENKPFLMPLRNILQALAQLRPLNKSRLLFSLCWTLLFVVYSVLTKACFLSREIPSILLLEQIHSG